MKKTLLTLLVAALLAGCSKNRVKPGNADLLVGRWFAVKDTINTFVDNAPTVKLLPVIIRMPILFNSIPTEAEPYTLARLRLHILKHLPTCTAQITSLHLTIPRKW